MPSCTKPTPRGGGPSSAGGGGSDSPAATSRGRCGGSTGGTRRRWRWPPASGEGVGDDGQYDEHAGRGPGRRGRGGRGEGGAAPRVPGGRGRRVRPAAFGGSPL